MLRLAKFLRRTAAVLIAAIALLYAWLSFTTVSAQDLPPLKDGDIVFQTSRSSQSTAILMASRSPYTHMGIVEIGSSGVPAVVEAVGPVKVTPLEDWIKRGLGGRIAIKRLDLIDSETAKGVLRAAHRYDGLPYDIFFLPSKDAIYCSELVSLAFSEGASIELGHAEKVANLSLDNFAARRLIEKRWQKHPLCQPAEAETFESCYAKILQQDLITPASIAADTKLKLVYSNYGALAN